MTRSSDFTGELSRLFWAVRDGQCSSEDLAMLEKLAQKDEQVRESYIRFTVMCGALRYLRIAEHCRLGTRRSRSAARSFGEFRVPRRHDSRRNRLLFFGLADGVPGGNGSCRGRAVHRLLGACVPACTGRQAFVGAQPGGCRAEDGVCR